MLKRQEIVAMTAKTLRATQTGKAGGTPNKARYRDRVDELKREKEQERRAKGKQGARSRA